MLDRQDSLSLVRRTEALCPMLLRYLGTFQGPDCCQGTPRVNVGTGERVTSLCHGKMGLKFLLDGTCSRAASAPQRPAADVCWRSQCDRGARKIRNPDVFSKE